MKLTKLHVFLILLVALTLCYTLGMCNKEGFTKSSKSPDNFVRHPVGETYRHGYSDYYANEDDATVSATNESKGLPDFYRNKYFNPNDRSHGGSRRQYNNDNNGYYNNDEMNGGDENDPSDMITSSFKHTKYNTSSRREKTNNNMYDSVSQGAMNGSMFSNSNSGSDLSNGSNGSNGTNGSNGITRDQIPNGQEDMYILKSQIVAPVCPACPPPPAIKCDNIGKKCPPCPPCARCPEPAFECKKVPNYNSSSLMGQLPIPWADKL